MGVTQEIMDLPPLQLHLPPLGKIVQHPGGAAGAEGISVTEAAAELGVGFEEQIDE